MKRYTAAIAIALTGCASAGNGVNTPAAIQSDGFIDNCQTFISVAAGDTCWGIVQRQGMSLDDFLSYNPQLNGANGCAENLIAGLSYCIKTINQPQPPTTKAATASQVGSSTPTPDDSAAAGADVRTRQRLLPAPSSWPRWLPPRRRAPGARATSARRTRRRTPTRSPAFPSWPRHVVAPAELSEYCACWNAGYLTKITRG